MCSLFLIINEFDPLRTKTAPVELMFQGSPSGAGYVRLGRSREPVLKVVRTAV